MGDKLYQTAFHDLSWDMKWVVEDVVLSILMASWYGLLLHIDWVCNAVFDCIFVRLS